MSRDEILVAITAGERPKTTYTFSLYRGTVCEHCGEPAGPLMRFSRSLPREVWICGEPDDESGELLICAVKVTGFDGNLAASVVADLEDLVVALNSGVRA